MKKIFTLIVLIHTIFNFENANASHIAGGSLTVQYTGITNTYLVKLTLYKDCLGIPLAPNENISIVGDTNQLSLNVNLVTSGPVSRGNCIPLNTCNNFTTLEVGEYEGTITLPSRRTDWLFSYNGCCRSSTVTNLMFCTGMSISALLDNQTDSINSLPQIIQPTISGFCLGIASTYSFNAFDVDGDSLAYSLIRPLDDIDSVIPYSPGFSNVNLVNQNIPVNFDSINGIISFTPNSGGYYVFAMQIREYKNGTLTGSITRDIVLNVTNGTYNPNQIQGTVYFDANSNNIKDVNEYGINGLLMNSPTSNTYGHINASGDYFINVITGTQTVLVNNIPYTLSPNPTSYTYNFPGVFQIIPNQDFALQPSPGGSDLEISLSGWFVRPNNLADYYLYLKNIGTDTVNATISVILDHNLTFYSSDLTPLLISGDTIKWSVDSILPFKQVEINFMAYCDPSTIIGTTITNTANVASSGPDQDLLNNVDTLIQTSRNSFDPNSKVASPSTGIYRSKLGEKFIDYHINFQNTGTALAINILITDTLSSSLDISTLEIITVSHQYKLEIIGTHILKFSFDSIFLPDSGSNEPLSKGYVIFRIKPFHSGITANSIVNRAAIYFDTNAPVITADAVTPILSNVGFINLNNDINSDLTLYPVPANGVLNYSLTGNEKIKNIVLTNILGERIMEVNSPINNTIQISQLPSGVYLFKCETTKGKHYVKKLIVNK